jgi:anaerobic ribonucleoside-triphosphate reductase activating protein
VRLSVGGVLERSAANGPGERFVVWTQGCSLGCAGCFNAQLWPRRGGRRLSTAVLARRINALDGLRGVTLTGGEPLEQPEAVCDLLARLDRRLDTVVFTGFTLEEIRSEPRRAPLLALADLVVAGRYERGQASDANPWAGSSNKAVVALTGRVGAAEYPQARVEAGLAADGTVTRTSFTSPPLRPILNK